MKFAHITDVHMSTQDTWVAPADMADTMLRRAIDAVNASDVDFVLFTGDLLDQATPQEMDRLREMFKRLEKPWHFVAGNHDGFIDPSSPMSYKPHEGVTQIDPRMAEPTPYAQEAVWSRSLNDRVQMIGLDSRYPDDWGGHVNDEQLAWLESELEAHQDKTVLIAIHHPIHPIVDLGKVNELLAKFILENYEEVEAVLDRYPNVIMVLSGHHHAHQLAERSGRLHVSTASLTGYPCVYRLIEMTSQGDEAWQIEIETVSHATAEERQSLKEAATSDAPSEWFAEGDAAKTWVEVMAGEEEDQSWEGVLHTG